MPPTPRTLRTRYGPSRPSSPGPCGGFRNSYSGSVVSAIASVSCASSPPAPAAQAAGPRRLSRRSTRSGGGSRQQSGDACMASRSASLSCTLPRVSTQRTQAATCPASVSTCSGGSRPSRKWRSISASGQCRTSGMVDRDQDRALAASEYAGPGGFQPRKATAGRFWIIPASPRREPRASREFPGTCELALGCAPRARRDNLQSIQPRTGLIPGGPGVPGAAGS